MKATYKDLNLIDPGSSTKKKKDATQPKIDPSVQKEKIEEFFLVTKILLAPRQCIHVSLEHELTAIKKEDSKEHDSVSCQNACFFCQGESSLIPIDSLDALKTLLELTFNTEIQLQKLPGVLEKKAEKLWSVYSRIGGVREKKKLESNIKLASHSLVLCLLGEGLIVPYMDKNKEEVLVRWGMQKPDDGDGNDEILACRSSKGWDIIPVQSST